jgi:hypothetical protein
MPKYSWIIAFAIVSLAFVFFGAARAAHLQNEETLWCAFGQGEQISDGTPIVLSGCSGAAGELRLANGLIWEQGNPGGCFTVPANAPEGTPVVFSRCVTNAVASQRWVFSEGHVVGPGGKCLAVNGSSDVGTPVVVKACASLDDRGAKEIWTVW